MRLLLVLLLTGCASTIHQSLVLSKGDSKQRVAQIMGTPDLRKFSPDKELWQYCGIGLANNDYVDVWFRKGVVSSIKTWKKNGQPYCSYPTYDWRPEADISVEVR